MEMFHENSLRFTWFIFIDGTRTLLKSLGQLQKQKLPIMKCVIQCTAASGELHRTCWSGAHPAAQAYVMKEITSEFLSHSRMPCWSLQHQGENGSMREPKLPKEMHTKALRTDNTAMGKLVGNIVLFLAARTGGCF